MTIPLAKLEPRLLRIMGPGLREEVDELAHAQGLMFLCPACFATNHGPIGTHVVIAWFRGVPDEEYPRPGRWEWSGTSLADLTLAPSIRLIGGCAWHGFVERGEVRTC